MKKTWMRWLIALIITLSAAVYQRMTGPTYPLRGSVKAGDEKIEFKLSRDHAGEGDQLISLPTRDKDYKATLVYRRYKTNDEWTHSEMWRDGGYYRGQLPHQPPAGKLEYYIMLEKNDQKWILPADRTVVSRFKGAVPVTVLAPHVLFMFIAMLLSTLTALEAWARTKAVFVYCTFTLVFLIIGGMILGPVVQKYAFGAYWTGVPFGWDLTDNKTLLAVLFWVIAWFALWKSGSNVVSRWLVMLAAVMLLLVYSIPHSVMGSELDYEKMEVVTGRR